eukprot:m.99108 g.99108  ORF g.99108 m.99108 type:complete len:94 (-) comp12450_c0_seq3:545-826(-)
MSRLHSVLNTSSSSALPLTTLNSTHRVFGKKISACIHQLLCYVNISGPRSNHKRSFPVQAGGVWVGTTNAEEKLNGCDMSSHTGNVQCSQPLA